MLLVIAGRRVVARQPPAVLRVNQGVSALPSAPNTSPWSRTGTWVRMALPRRRLLVARMAYSSFPELTVDDRFVLAQEPIARDDVAQSGRPRSLAGADGQVFPRRGGVRLCRSRGGWPPAGTGGKALQLTRLIALNTEVGARSHGCPPCCSLLGPRVPPVSLVADCTVRIAI
jgi:hypothetical protein